MVLIARHVLARLDETTECGDLRDVLAQIAAETLTRRVEPALVIEPAGKRENRFEIHRTHDLATGTQHGY